MDDERRKRERDWIAFWRRHDAMEARLTRPVSERMLELAGVSRGMNVLDVASGRGEPAMLAAQRVGAEGSVLAVDLSEGMLQIARERAEREGLTNVELRVADAEALEVGERRFDVATLRWGLMYMNAPERALSSIHRALVPGGKLVIASWAEPERVSYASLPRRLLERYAEVPPMPGGASPGVFRHADRARLEGELERCGFAVEASEELDIPVVEASDSRGLVTWLRELGGPLMAILERLPREQQEAWEADLSAEVERHRVGDRVTLGGVTRITVCSRRSSA